MSDISRRRRHTGRALLVAGLLALPLTASITYANAPDAPPAPPAPVAPPAPFGPVALQVAPEVEVEEVGEGEDRQVYVIRKVEKDADAVGEDARKVERERRVVVMGEGGKLSEEERARIMAEVRAGLDEADVELEAARKEMRVAMIELENSRHGVTKVNIECRRGDEGAEWRGKDGESIARVCTSDIMASALSGLKEARAEIAKNTEMDAQTRAEVLKALDEKIAEWNRRD